MVLDPPLDQVLDAPDLLSIRCTLKELHSRRLIAAGTWLGELLLSIHPSKRRSTGKIVLEREDDEDAIAAARASMDAHEYERAAHFLRNATSQRARFLAIYSQFLASERAALQEFHTMDGTRHQPPFPTNKSVSDLHSLVAGATDGWIMFLEALFLYKLDRKSEAITVLLKSVTEVPWNWSAWCLLSDCADTEADFNAILARIPVNPRHPVVWLFQIKASNDLYLPCQTHCDTMLQVFESSPWLFTQKARSCYTMGFLQQSQQLFESVVAAYPYRLESVDIFSSILYMNGDLTKLSHFATVYKVHTHSPEVCVFIGNTYSLRLEHEKAAQYYMRATRLNPTFSHAYTLLGHAFMDMANTHAAIQAYRRALSITPKDFRAWFGLGQSYRTMGMALYSLYYYRRAHNIRPHDIAIWEGMGTAFEILGRREEAIQAYQTSIEKAQHHRLPSVHFKLAKLGVDAAGNYEEVIVLCKDEKLEAMSEWNINSLVEGGELAMRQHFDFPRARRYLMRAAECTNFPEEATRAEKLLKELTQKEIAVSL